MCCFTGPTGIVKKHYVLGALRRLERLRGLRRDRQGVWCKRSLKDMTFLISLWRDTDPQSELQKRPAYESYCKLAVVHRTKGKNKSQRISHLVRLMKDIGNNVFPSSENWINKILRWGSYQWNQGWGNQAKMSKWNKCGRSELNSIHKQLICIV
jgi:hypothetical protein